MGTIYYFILFLLFFNKSYFQSILKHLICSSPFQNSETLFQPIIIQFYCIIIQFKIYIFIILFYFYSDLLFTLKFNPTHTASTPHTITSYSFPLALHGPPPWAIQLWSTRCHQFRRHPSNKDVTNKTTIFGERWNYLVMLHLPGLFYVTGSDSFIVWLAFNTEIMFIFGL